MKTFEVEVTRIVRITLDETKFTPAFFERVAKLIAPMPNLTDHVIHLAREWVDGAADNGEFVEGYGQMDEMGISFDDLGSESCSPVIIEPGQ